MNQQISSEENIGTLLLLHYNDFEASTDIMFLAVVMFRISRYQNGDEITECGTMVALSPAV
jgi:hypothetical protein